MDFFKNIVDGKLVDVEADDDEDGSPATGEPDTNDASQADVTK